MKLVLVFLFFVKFSFAYQLYSPDGNNLSESKDHEELYRWCDFNRDIKPSEINDADMMKCILDNWWIRYDYKILYCEPPKILDENNECVLEIDFKQWKNVLKSFTGYDFIYLKNEGSKKHRKIFGKQRYIGDRSTFAAIGKTSEGKYELFEMETCYDKIKDLVDNDKMRYSKKFAEMAFQLPILAPQLLSIICYSVLLVLYFTIEDLKRTIYGKCWINFIVNSLINYLATIVLLILTHLRFLYKYDFESRVIVKIMVLPIGSIVLLTEFSLYFWLNITFFEAFYIIR
jgi:hypothetical protein